MFRLLSLTLIFGVLFLSLLVMVLVLKFNWKLFWQLMLENWEEMRMYHSTRSCRISVRKLVRHRDLIMEISENISLCKSFLHREKKNRLKKKETYFLRHFFYVVFSVPTQQAPSGGYRRKTSLRATSYTKWQSTGCNFIRISCLNNN